MSFCSTAIEQREKESKTLTTFLTYSLIGSLVIHIGLLASGIGSLLTKVPVEEPLEITFVESPPEEIKPIEQPEEKIKPKVVDNSRIFTSSNNSDSSPSVFLPQPQKSTVVSSQPPVIPALKTEPLKPLPSITKETVAPKKLDTQPQEVSQSKDTDIKPLSTEKSPVQVSSQSSFNLSKLLAGVRDGRANKEVLQPSQATSDNGGNIVGASKSSGVTGNGSATIGSGNSSTSGNNDNSSSSANNGQTNGSKVATAPTRPKLSSNSGNGNGRAACRECDANYPEWARKKGLEGRVEVAVDTDEKGNITNVRLLRSSGNEKLDAEHLERAQKWKLKPSSGGRQGVNIGTEYAIAGSQRYRQLQERKKQRETEQRNTESTNNVSNSLTETPTRSRRLVTSVSENIPKESTTETRRIRRRRNVAASTSTPSTTQGQRLGEALRRRTDQAATNTSSSPVETRKRRRRREITPASSVNTNSENSPKSTRWRRRLEQPPSSKENQQPSQPSDTN